LDLIFINSYLLEMYRKYKSDGFEILGVSQDEQKEG
jgi:glutathione peroxidase-family protein